MSRLEDDDPSSGRGLPPSRRPLTAAERRLIRLKIQHYARVASRTARAALYAGGLVTFVLWLVTIAASDAPWAVVTAFWAVVGGAITLWVHRDLSGGGRHANAMVHMLESALRRNAADVYDVRAASFAAFEEIEDEGACYAFDLGDRRHVFIAGQEFYESARFPSLDFSLVYVLEESDRTADMFIQKRGIKATPRRRISSAVKARLDVPGHLDVRVGRFDDLYPDLDDSAAR